MRSPSYVASMNMRAPYTDPPSMRIERMQPLFRTTPPSPRSRRSPFTMRIPSRFIQPSRMASVADGSKHHMVSASASKRLSPAAFIFAVYSPRVSRVQCDSSRYHAATAL